MPLLSHQYRHLTLRHEQRLLANKPPTLDPGHAKFNSYFLPSLNAGQHTIDVSQTVTATLPPGREGDPDLIDDEHQEPRQRKTFNMPQSQSFTVLAPQYKLPEEAIVSVFPSPGHTATPLTLPHIVLKDPHVPWERTVADAKANDADTLNSIPWIALVVFTAEVLTLEPADRSGYLGLDSSQQPTETLGFTVDIKDAVAQGKIPRPAGRGVFLAKPDDGPMASQSNDTMSLVTFPATLFHKLFVKDIRSIGDPGPVYKSDIAKFRLLSHVRTVATNGMISTAETDGEPGTFALCVSCRVGPQTITTPTTMYAHVLSLEDVHGSEPPLLDAAGKAKVVMTSLYSWTYTALPPGSLNVVHMLENLGTTGLSVLRTDRMATVDRLESDMEKKITQRQKEGFTLTRYRTITGEETAAMLRGPLAPVKVPHPLQPGMTFQTNFGTDLNILDPDMGLLDISYSTAWQLGRTLAMGDPAFTAALARLRGLILRESLSKAKEGIHVALGSYAGTRSEVLDSSATIVAKLNAMNARLASSSALADVTVSTDRWRRGVQTLPTVDTGLHAEHIFHQVSSHADQVARVHSRAAESDAPASYHDIPNNPDYTTVQSWILDRLHLAGIPAHYLITDPSHVPPESLRFFHVDENWTEAMIDGALSLANHATSLASEDFVRSAIKKQLQDYMDTPLKGLGYCQQMPKYGFILRSQILVQFPDLAVSADFAKSFRVDGEDWDKAKPQAPILVQRRLASDMMLVLFDRTPPNLTSLELSLPPHQQTFVVGTSLDSTTLGVTHVKVYATNDPNASPHLDPPKDVNERRFPLEPQSRPYEAEELLDVVSGVLNVESYASLIHGVLKKEMKEGMYTEQGPTAAVLALQLNEPIHTLRIAIPSEWHAQGVEARHFADKGAFSFRIPDFPLDKYTPKSQLTSYRSTSKTLNGNNFGLPNRQVIPNSLPRLHGPFGPSMESSHPDAGALADKPDFIFSIYPFEYDTFIPTNRSTPTDLIVKILLRYQLDLSLLQLDVIIDLGRDADEKLPPDEPWKPRPLAADMSHTDAAAPTMLSNLHFNVIRRFEDHPMDATQESDTPSILATKRVMRLSLIPRSSKGVNMKTMTEASFLLPLVNVLPWKPPPGVKYVTNVQLKAKWEARWLGQDPPNGRRPIYEHTFSYKVYMAEEEVRNPT